MDKERLPSPCAPFSERNESFDQSNGRCRLKEESYPSIPWQRRDMSRKEEYEFLEMNPFSDLAEFSLKYPHVHQRTYYRWKRRIKEEFIVLEQCPEMSFDQFSSVVLQAKKNVFNLWKNLIAQGKGFYNPSNESSCKKPDIKTSSSSTKNTNNLGAEYAYLRQHLSVSFEHFCKKFPNISPCIFNDLMGKIMQEFNLFYKNRQMSWKEFSKLVNVSEEVFKYWQEYAKSYKPTVISSDMNHTIGSYSPDSHQNMIRSSFSQSPVSTDPRPHPFAKENIPSSTKSERFSPQALQLDQAMKNSMNRSLPASYLNSLQNMMIPWPSSYYNMSPALGQPMLPMMLWPRMLGLAAASSLATNPLAINSLGSPSSSSISVAATHANSPLDLLSNISMEAIAPHSAKLKNESTDANRSLHAFKASEIEVSKSCGSKRASTDFSQEDVGHREIDAERNKKMKIKDDQDGGMSPYSRSRKQNKQEYVYYLKNPELCFKDLETLFPSISVRTFYRWRKEMNAAVVFIEDKKDLDFSEFKAIFPDIPEDVFDSWKTRAGNILPSRALPHDSERSSDEGRFNPIDFQESTIESKITAGFEEYSKYDPYSSSVCSRNVNDMHPARDDDSLGYDLTIQGRGNNSLKSDGHCTEFVYLQINPFIEFSQFTCLYPHISSDTFYRWKSGIQNVYSYVSDHPDVHFSDILSIMPDVAEEAFHKWKSMIQLKRNDIVKSDSLSETSANVDGDVKTKMTEALLYLMHNPNMSYSHFCRKFNFVSLETFHLWLNRIKMVILHISSNPNLDYAGFSSAITDVGEDIFNRWKNLTEEDISLIGMQCEQDNTQENGHHVRHKESDRSNSDAMAFCQKYPNATFEMFSHEYPSISHSQFQNWMHKISNQILFIRQNPCATFEEFTKVYNDVPETRFESWKYSLPASHTSPSPNLNVNFENSLKNDPKTYKDNKSPFLCSEDERRNGDVKSKTKVEIFIHNSKSQDSRNNFLESYHPVTVDAVSSDSSKQLSCGSRMISETNESSLSKLAKFAESNVPLYTSWTPGIETGRDKPPEYLSTSSTDCINQLRPNNSSSNNCPSQITEGIEKDNNNVTANDILSQTSSSCHISSSSEPSNLSSKLSDPLSTRTSPMKEMYSSHDNVNKFSSQYEHNDDDGGTSKGNKHISENTSLSALMIMSTKKYHHPNPSINSNQNSEIPKSSPQTSCTKGWNSAQASAKDDDEIFSSQRQKKMSRAEYLFVKDNPDVDSQEFARIFPGVSARTFYRWKKEIKSQFQSP